MKKTELKKLKRSGKKSMNARLVAKDVIEAIENGRKVNLGAIIKKRGYSDAMAIAPTKVTQQEGYREVVDPFVEKMLKERDAAIKRMAKVRSKAKYRDLTDAIDKFTKNAQLLAGKPTDRVAETIQIYVPERQ